MNNYKELVSALREEAEAVKAVEWDIPICTSNHIAEAADAIDRLCFELELERCQHNATLKERDAAIADLKVNWLCAVCKKRVVTREWMRCDSKDFCEAPCEVPTCLNFEWRGVQEVNG